MRLHVHRWRYPAGGATMRICRKCVRWQILEDCSAGLTVWVWQERER